MTAQARCVCSQNSLGVSGRRRVLRMFCLASTCASSKTARQTPARRSDRAKNFATDGNAPRATPALVEANFHGEAGEGGAPPHLPPRRKQEGPEPKTRDDATVLAARCLDPPLLNRPSRRPSRSRRSGQERPPALAVGPRPKVWFLRAFAAGAV